jgi:hypothetical protein
VASRVLETAVGQARLRQALGCTSVNTLPADMCALPGNRSAAHLRAAVSNLSF